MITSYARAYKFLKNLLYRVKSAAQLSSWLIKWKLIVVHALVNHSNAEFESHSGSQRYRSISPANVDRN